MKCLICGRLSLPGAKLCLDCKAARKRAFDATVTQPLLAAAGAARASRNGTAARRLIKPEPSAPDAARRAAKMAMTAQAQSNASGDLAHSPPPRAARWPMIVIGACLLVGIAGYFGHWLSGGRSDSFAGVPERPNAASPEVPSIVVAPAPTAVPVPAPTTTAAIVPAASDATIAETTSIKANTAKRPNRSRAEKPAAAAPIPEPPPPPQEVAVAPAPPPVVREAPRVDPFQVMYDAIARCPRDISGRASCEQRLRAQYCEGHWGQVSQCASIPYVDHGS